MNFVYPPDIDFSKYKQSILYDVFLSVFEIFANDLLLNRKIITREDFNTIFTSGYSTLVQSVIQLQSIDYTYRTTYSVKINDILSQIRLYLYKEQEKINTLIISLKTELLKKIKLVNEIYNIDTSLYKSYVVSGSADALPSYITNETFTNNINSILDFTNIDNLTFEASDLNKENSYSVSLNIDVYEIAKCYFKNYYDQLVLIANDLVDSQVILERDSGIFILKEMFNYASILPQEISDLIQNYIQVINENINVVNEYINSIEVELEKAKTKLTAIEYSFSKKEQVYNVLLSITDILNSLIISGAVDSVPDFMSSDNQTSLLQKISDLTETIDGISEIDLEIDDKISDILDKINQSKGIICE